MAQAEADQVSVYIYEETSWGALSTALAMSAVPITGHNLGMDKTTIVSDTIRSDRMVDTVVATSTSASGSIDFDFQYEETFNKLLAAAVGGAWATNVLVQGTTKKSYSIEAKYPDIVQFSSIRGARVSEFNLNIPVGQKATGSCRYLGKSKAAAGTSIAASVAAYAANQVYSANADLGTLKEGGAALSTVIKSITLNIAANTRLITGVTQAAPFGINLGVLDITGSIEAYFEDLVLLNKFLNHTKSSLEFTLTTSGGGKSYLFLIPAIYYAGTGGNEVVTGKNTEVMLTLPFQAVKDSVTGNEISITRVPT
mgnify:CR=1 FL=1